MLKLKRQERAALIIRKGDFLENDFLTPPPLPFGPPLLSILYMVIIGHMAAAPLACPNRSVRPLACPCRSARPRYCLNKINNNFSEIMYKIDISWFNSH